MTESMSQYREDSIRFETLVSEAADAWSFEANRLACSGQFPSFYLYYEPGGEHTMGGLYMLTDEQPVKSLVLGDSEAYRCNLTRDQVRARIWRVARTLPLYPWGK